MVHNIMFYYTGIWRAITTQKIHFAKVCSKEHKARAA